MELDLFLNRNKIKKDNVFYAASSSFINDRNICPHEERPSFCTLRSRSTDTGRVCKQIYICLPLVEKASGQILHLSEMVDTACSCNRSQPLYALAEFAGNDDRCCRNRILYSVCGRIEKRERAAAYASAEEEAL